MEARTNRTREVTPPLKGSSAPSPFSIREWAHLLRPFVRRRHADADREPARRATRSVWSLNCPLARDGASYAAQRARIRLPGLVLADRRRGDRKFLSDRLDPLWTAVRVDERLQVSGRRSGSAWSKYAGAMRRISFARQSSRFSRTSASSRARPSLVSPGRTPEIAFGTPGPSAKRPGRTSNLRRHRDDGRPLRSELVLVARDQPHGPFPQLREMTCSGLLHSGFTRVGISGRAGAIRFILACGDRVAREKMRKHPKSPKFRQTGLDPFRPWP